MNPWIIIISIFSVICSWMRHDTSMILRMGCMMINAIFIREASRTTPGTWLIFLIIRWFGPNLDPVNDADQDLDMDMWSHLPLLLPNPHSRSFLLPYQPSHPLLLPNLHWRPLLLPNSRSRSDPKLDWLLCLVILLDLPLYTQSVTLTAVFTRVISFIVLSRLVIISDSSLLLSFPSTSNVELSSSSLGSSYTSMESCRFPEIEGPCNNT